MSVFQTVKKTIEFFVNIPLLAEIKLRKSKTVLLLSPQYLNYGDHLIAAAETDFIKKVSGRKPLDINYTFFDLWNKKAKKAVNDDDIIWITGGGYIGDLWSDSHAAVEAVIDAYPMNTIIFAPQTTFYSDIESDEAKKFAEKVKSHGRCVFFSREKRTVETLEKLGIESVSAPDFGLLFDFDLHCKKEPKYISFCFRDDQEGIIDKNTAEKTEKELLKYNKPYHKIVMAKQHREIPAWSRKFFIKRMFAEYSDSSVIITDRLHCMIYSALAGTPCVVLDNKSKKISGVYEWIRELDYIKLIDSTEEIVCSVDEVIKYSDRNENLKNVALLTKKLNETYSPVFKKYIR